MYKSKLLAFLLSFIPGLGHAYLGRKRAILYFLGFFGALGIGFALAILGEPSMIIPSGLIAAFIWGITMLDILITLSQIISSTNATNSDQQQNARFQLILLSVLPGLAHFQLGFMSRGLSFLISFFGIFIMVGFVTFISREGSFLIFLGALPILWLYGLFDSLRLLVRKQQGEEVADRTIFEEFDQYREDGKKSKMIATFLAIFPGAGHLYLGLQRRGIQLMAAFLLSLYILDVLRLSLFLFLIPILWFYSFFDALQQVSRHGREELQDRPIIDWVIHYQKWVGVGLFILGLFYLFDQLLIRIIEIVFPEFQFGYMIKSYIQTAIVSILLIGGGIKLMVGNKGSKVRVKK